MAEGRRVAVQIASDSYSDSKLSQLKAPRPDASKLEKILKNESITGGYDEVKILYNEQSNTVLRELERLFKKAAKSDMILVYVAGHGHKSIDDSLLYLATCDTDLDLIDSSTIPAKSIRGFMQRSKSSNIILILDCCFSGAFSRGMLSRSSMDKSINLKEEFSDSGCVILTSASSMQYAWEGSELKKEHPSIQIEEEKIMENSDEYSSIYTKYLIEGLETGKADSDSNGEIGCIELHEYIKNKMREEGHPQTPEITMLKGDVIIAANTKKKTMIDAIEATTADTKSLLQLLQDEKVTDFNTLRKTRQDNRLSFEGVELNGKKLTNVDLHSVNLTNAKLVNTIMRGANLDDANLKGADLTDADLTAATLYKADLSEAVLVRCNLRGATLRGMIDFTDANLLQADLRGADLDGMVNFEGANLEGVNFTGANINPKLTNFNNTDTKNSMGLSLSSSSFSPDSQKNNKYVESINAFSDSIMKKIISNGISQDDSKYLEEDIKKILKDVEEITDIKNLQGDKRKDLEIVFTKVAEQLFKILPESDVYMSFGILQSFDEITNNALQAARKSTNTKLQPIKKMQNENEFFQLIQKGNDLSSNGEQQGAIEWYDRALKIQSDNAIVLNNKGLALHQLGKYDEAIEWYDRALKIQSDNAIVLNNKGLALHQLGKYDEAIEWYDRALEMKPYYVNVLNNKGLALHQLGKYDEAIEWYDRALEIKSDEAWIKDSWFLDVRFGDTKKYKELALGLQQKKAPSPIGLSYQDSTKIKNPQKKDDTSSLSSKVKSSRVPKISTTIASKTPVFEKSWKIKEAPTYITVDSKGFIYTSAASRAVWGGFIGNSCVYKHSNNGIFVDKWGSKGSGSGQFHVPTGIAIDSKDQVYVADNYNYRVQKFDSDGNFLAEWGSMGYGSGQFQNSAGIAIDSKDQVYVADNYNYRVQKFDSDGNFLAEWGSMGYGSGQFQNSAGIAIDSKDQVYVAEENSRVQKFDSDGNFLAEWRYVSSESQFNRHIGIAIDSKDHVYVTDSSTQRVQKFDSDGNFLAEWGSEGSDNGQFNRPSGIAIDSKDQVYVANSGNHKIQKWT